MIIDIKERIKSIKGKRIKILVDVGRNKNEEYEGFVLNTYKNVWTFQTDTDIKSFCYSDVLTDVVIISS